MKSGKEIRLGLEILEDRMALSGAFGGAIDAGVPATPPIPGLMTSTVAVPPSANFRDSFAVFNSMPSNQAQFFQNQLQSFQNQLQSFQTDQMNMMNQYFSDLESLFQHTYFIVP